MITKNRDAAVRPSRASNPLPAYATQTTAVCLEVVNPSFFNAVGLSVANLYVATPFVGATYAIDLANVYIISPAALLANGVQIADVFIGSPSAGEFMGVDGYNVYIGSPAYLSKAGFDPTIDGVHPLIDR